MNDLVYPRERTLGTITLVLGILVWLVLVVSTLGIVLGVLLLLFIAYLFAQSMLISYIKGNGVELSAEQFPDLHAQFEDCCKKLQMNEVPKAYVLNGDGGLNAFATKFLGTQYVVLLSSVVDAMKSHPDGTRFYLGHELGHLRRKHLSWTFLRWPVLWLPLVGAAYSRACESTCDRHGRACCATPENAARAAAALAAGSERWSDINLKAYVAQTHHSRGFWMSFHELTGAYPWLTKRVARLLDPEAKMPARNVFAGILSAFVPYAGRLGGAFGALIMVYVLGVLAAIAIPAYMDYTARAKLSQAVTFALPATAAIGKYYIDKKEIPESLEAAGINPKPGAGQELQFDSNSMVLSAVTPSGTLVFTPRLNDEEDAVLWTCSAGDDLKMSRLPANCKLDE